MVVDCTRLYYGIWSVSLGLFPGRMTVESKTGGAVFCRAFVKGQSEGERSLSRT